MSWFAVVLSARYWESALRSLPQSREHLAFGTSCCLLLTVFRLQDPAEIYGLVGFIALSISIVWLASAGLQSRFRTDFLISILIQNTAQSRMPTARSRELLSTS